MLREPRKYDAILEVVSKPFLELITDYRVDEAWEMTVSQETKELYEFIKVLVITPSPKDEGF